VRLVILRPKISWTLLAVLDQEGNQVTGKLEYGDIGIEVQTVDTFTLENNMLVGLRFTSLVYIRR
jgi:hypothetical protein